MDVHTTSLKIMKGKGRKERKGNTAKSWLIIRTTQKSSLTPGETDRITEGKKHRQAVKKTTTRKSHENVTF